MDTSVFFPPQSRPGERLDYGPALAVCARCPVTEPCLADAIRYDDTGHVYGVRGGKTPAQRKRLKADMRAKNGNIR